MSPSPTVNAWGAASDQWKKQQGAVPTSQVATPQPAQMQQAPAQATATVQQQPWKAPWNYYGQSQGTQGMAPATQQPYQPAPAAQPWSGAGMGPSEGATFSEEQPSGFGQAPMESAPPQIGAQSQRRSPMSQMGMQPKQRNYYGS